MTLTIVGYSILNQHSAITADTNGSSLARRPGRSSTAIAGDFDKGRYTYTQRRRGTGGLALPLHLAPVAIIEQFQRLIERGLIVAAIILCAHDSGIGESLGGDKIATANFSGIEMEDMSDTING